MNRQESKHSGRPEARVQEINPPAKGAVGRLFAYGLPYERRKRTVSNGGEEVQGRLHDEADTAGTHRRGPH